MCHDYLLNMGTGWTAEGKYFQLYCLENFNCFLFVLFVYTYVCMYVYMYVYVCVCMYVCMCSLTFGTGVFHLIQINHQPDATIFHFIILTFVYSSTFLGRFPVHHQEFNDCSGSLWFYLRIVVTVVLCSWSGRPARPQPTTLLPPRSYGKPEAAAAVDRLLMMGGEDARNMLSCI
jgi:hypothetical protein